MMYVFSTRRKFETRDSRSRGGGRRTTTRNEINDLETYSRASEQKMEFCMLHAAYVSCIFHL